MARLKINCNVIVMFGDTKAKAYSVWSTFVYCNDR